MTLMTATKQLPYRFWSSDEFATLVGQIGSLAISNPSVYQDMVKKISQFHTRRKRSKDTVSKIDEVSIFLFDIKFLYLFFQFNKCLIQKLLDLNQTTDNQPVIKTAMTIVIDHKKFEASNKTMLGILDRLTIYFEQDGEIKSISMFILGDLIDVTNVGKDNKTTAELVQKHLNKLGVWQRMGDPEIKIAADFAITGSISNHFDDLQMQDSDFDIITCKGHNANNAEQTTDSTTATLLQNDLYSGKSYIIFLG